MKLEHLKEEYPVIPEDIRTMIECEVKKQIESNSENKIVRKSFGRKSWKKAAAIALAATMALGTTVFAASKIYRMYTEKDGNYGLKTGVVADETAAENLPAIPEKIPVLAVNAAYLPEGMVAAADETLKYYYENTPYQGGISIAIMGMDAELSAEELPLSDTYVIYHEELSINGHDAVYLEKQTAENGSLSFDKKFYVAYPEYYQIIEIFVGENVSKEEAMEIVKNMEIKPTGETVAFSNVYTWSEACHAEEEGDEVKLTASEDEMSNMHQVGEQFAISTTASTDSEEWMNVDTIQAEVSEVQILDDYSLLNDEFVDNNLKAALGEDGKLVKNEIRYIKSGDGIESLDETEKTETVDQKLVYVTVNFTNTGEEELKDVLFFASFLGMTKEESGYTFYNRAMYDGDNGTDIVSGSSIGAFGEMDYYDIRGGERSNNYIPSLSPGETVTVHVAKVVNEDEMDKMYLSLNSYGGAYEFTEEAMETGYVDIRQ